MEFNIDKSNTLFKRMLELYGADSAEALHWRNAESQQLRYDIFSKIGDFENKSILDVGAGLGDYYAYIYSTYDNFEYLGLDVLEDFVEGAKKKYPDANFVKADLLTYKPEKKYDYVISCGALNVVIGDMEKLVRQAIKAFYDNCNIACGFNLLSNNAIYKDNSLYNYEPIEILKFCSEITPYITYEHSFLDNDFTIFIYKDGQANI